MAFMTAFGPCICCHRPFSYNPERVPSTSAITGQREPVCADCMAAINARRARMGLAPFGILPNAYEAEEVP
jgi:hypothetical protein